MQGQHLAVYHHVHRFVQIELHTSHRLALGQRMINVRAIIKSGQVSYQPQPPDRAPANVFDKTAIYLSLGSNHHRPAGKLAVVERKKKTATPVEFGFTFHPHRKRPPLQSSQTEKKENEESQFSVAAKSPRP